MEGTADQISDQLRQERIAAVLLSPVGFVCARAVSALAHMLETHGTPTVAIGLVRPRIDRARPPRGLWTPFQLGRLLDEPGDSEFQRRVLLRALGLLERGDGPVILEDFPDDPPSWFDAPGQDQQRARQTEYHVDTDYRP